MKVHMEYAEVKAAQVSKDREVAIENIEKNRGLCLRRKSRSPSLIYSFMGHDTLILADCLLYEDMAACMAVDMLPMLPRLINKITYDRDGYTINYLLDCNFSNTSLSYLCV
nr:putative vesicle-associated membrane protein 726 [Malus domestica]